MKAGFALGSNLGDRVAALRTGRDLLHQRLGARREKTFSSSLWETIPVDCPEGSGLFLNAVVELDFPSLSPEELLSRTQGIEVEAGRIRTGIRNAPRILDVDILYVDDLVLDSEELTIPHPRISERKFVLFPLAEIQPERILPGQNLQTAELLRKLPGHETDPDPGIYQADW